MASISVGLYAFAGGLVGVVALIRKEWLPYAILASVVVSAVAFNLNDSKEAPSVHTNAAKEVAGDSQGVLKDDEFQDFKLIKKTETSHNTAIYRFALPKENDILGLPIGQHISLQANIDGQDVVRSYTPISSDEEDKGYFDLMIKSYPQGNISRHMSTLKVGDTMKVRGPKGQMRYTPNMCRSIGMIAGGTGITPMLQVARAIHRGRPHDKTVVDLIFANVNEDDILLRQELDQLAREDDKFNVHYVLNNPPDSWSGGVGFVTAEIMKGNLPAPAEDIKIMVCGPPPMVAAIKKAALSLGYDKAKPVSKLNDQVFCF